jgi:oxalate decarboxylase/phosphoglucose isomerase-like protein (cupin superfamily)
MYTRNKEESPKRERSGLVFRTLLQRSDLVYVPPGAVHGIENTSEDVLTYVSAATPALDAEAAYDAGQLRPEG